MKLGFITAILQDYSFEQMIDFASEQGFKCVEVACWPKGKVERRYAGVTHIDINELTANKISYINNYCKKSDIEISSLAFYSNTMDQDLQKREENIEHIKKLIVASEQLGVNMISTFIGRVQDKTVEENMDLFKKIWTPIVKFAEEHQTKIAIENCPMLFTNDQWPGGQNLFTSPANWTEMFKLVPSDYLGINYDPSHFIWQKMDYIRPIYEFKDKIFHAHVKDIKVYKDKLDRVGIMAYPLQYMSPKLPGLGDVNWGKYISALTDVGYSGYICIEIEDKAYESCEQDVLNSLIISKRYISQFII